MAKEMKNEDGYGFGATSQSCNGCGVTIEHDDDGLPYCSGCSKEHSDAGIENEHDCDM